MNLWRLALVSLLVPVGCGGIAVVELHDASADNAVPIDAGAEDATRFDASGWGLPACDANVDCWGLSQTCQQGWCCAGALTEKGCICGSEPGCDITKVCCKDKGSGVSSCVSICR